ncbi:hypothetical protein [Urechidicola vernalis]|uniref:DUF1634 domain-containing protein n=1 Tax=Urechidicola vernalis TaxID=3075600 RepID=A0ABU2Y4T3_9FLAO|nr:hypothetical protein [Urechidicola sp. P050]MDT0553207.1 hypothetical protein [Urechidicola sp. P050]
MNKEIAIGFVVAIIATVTGFFGYAEFVSDLGFDETIDFIIKGKLYGKVLTLAAIPNLFVFFVFIKKKQDYRARGVLIFTILLAVTVSVLKFI